MAIREVSRMTTELSHAALDVLATVKQLTELVVYPAHPSMNTEQISMTMSPIVLTNSSPLGYVP